MPNLSHCRASILMPNRPFQPKTYQVRPHLSCRRVFRTGSARGLLYSTLLYSSFQLKIGTRRTPAGFLPARRYSSAVFAPATSRRVSVSLSVRLSVRPSHAGIVVPSRAKAGSWNVHHLIAPWLVFAYPDIRYPDIRIYPLTLWQPKIRIS